jgi:RHS repeat-associated protein
MGNLLSEASTLNGTTSYSYNTKNQLVSKTAPDGAHTFAYDSAGNLLSETLNGATIKTLEYDATGRFVKGTNASGETTEYTYNALGYRVANTVTRANPNAAYANSANSGGSEYTGSVEDTIDAWDSNDFYTRIDGSGKSRQNEISVEEKIYIPDFTTGGLSDIFISAEGLYDQTLTWGLGLISVETVAAPGSGASVQQTIAAEYNFKAYAHSNRLGGVSFFTDADGELVTYNEFDAWGVSYTGQPEDANYSGFDVLTGFTGYTWDAVLDVYFAQARLYDAGSKRFAQADPAGGSVANPLSLNAYLYCRDDPVDNIDPTGMVMPGDENLSAQKQGEIAVFTQQWNAANAAGDRAGMDAAHANADAVRNRQESSPGSAGNSGNNSSGAYSAAYYQWQIITAMLPPTNFSILVEEIAKFVPTLTLSEVLKTASEWVNKVRAQTKSVKQPLQDILVENSELYVVSEAGQGISQLAWAATENIKPPSYTKADLIRDLNKAVDAETNFLQAVGQLPFNSTKEALEIVLFYDVYITEVAKDNNMNKALLQTVLFQEIRFYNALDVLSDTTVIETYVYKHQLEEYLELPAWMRIFIPAPNVPIMMKSDSSTGLGQIFASTAIDALNWKGDRTYDADNWKDIGSVWVMLHDDDNYNIKMAGLVLARAAFNVDVEISSTKASDIKKILARYNGRGSAADNYGNYTYEYYMLFNRYNVLQNFNS